MYTFSVLKAAVPGRPVVIGSREVTEEYSSSDQWKRSFFFLMYLISVCLTDIKPSIFAVLKYARQL